MVCGQANSKLKQNESNKLMSDPLIFVSIKCQVGQIFDSKYKSSAYEAMKKEIGVIMAKNSSTFTMDKAKGDAPVQFEWTVTLNVTRDDKSTPPKLVAKVKWDGFKFTSGRSAKITAEGGANYEGLHPNKLDKDAAEATTAAVESVMLKKVIPAMTP
jgi:hypothetical protein